SKSWSVTSSSAVPTWTEASTPPSTVHANVGPTVPASRVRQARTNPKTTSRGRRANVSLRDSFPQRGRSEWIAGATHPAPGARAPGVQRRHPAPLNAASACWCAGADLGKEGIEVRLEERLPVNEAHRLGVDLDLV